jgi:Protein of unknown function (DUF433).
MIVRKNGVRSGKPVIEGSRVTVKDVADRFYDLDRSLDSISSDLGIDRDEAEEALRFYHREIVEARENTAKV